MSESCCSNIKKSCCSADGVAAANISVVSTSLSLKDTIGRWKARWGLGRMNYKVEPGLYAVGKPNEDSPVFVTANYKMTFDSLRKNLTDMNCWILVLDTDGINVWCSAGEGTFGACELVSRIEAVKLSERVKHRKLILPQLSASGVNAKEVAERSGFSVIYGPVKASDIKEFILSGYKATKEMRTIKFPFWDRLELIPIELVEVGKKLLPIFGVLFLLNLIAARQFGMHDFIAYMGANIVGAAVVPMFLPYIPGKAFSLKGWLLGLCWIVFTVLLFGWYAAPNRLLALGYLLLFPALSSYLALNFTGCTTYTSPSGVLKEMKIAMPLIIVSSLIGVVLVLTNKLFL